MNVQILVEGRSEQRFLTLWCRRAGVVDASVYPHEGRGELPANPHAQPDPRNRTLLHQLPAKLRGFAGAHLSGRVIILLDADNDDPAHLAAAIRDLADDIAPKLTVDVCVATEELEAFYLGDLKGLRAAYPDADMVKARQYVPDSVVGTWELFGEIIGDESGDKVGWAQTMGAKTTTSAAESRSPSFKAFVAAACRSHGDALPSKKRIRTHHPPRPRDHSGKR